MARITIKDLDAQIVALKLQMAELNIAKAQSDTQVEEYKTKVQQLEDEARTSGERLTEALAAANAPHPTPAVPTVRMIARPSGRASPYKNMGVSRSKYRACQRIIHDLVIKSGLDITEDFRRLDSEKLGILFAAAKKAQPVLKRYENNWATAAIARQYIQNKRKHGYRNGYIMKKGATAPAVHDDDDGMDVDE